MFTNEVLLFSYLTYLTPHPVNNFNPYQFFDSGRASCITVYRKRAMNMGFVYQGRKLCCDFCGTAGAVKVRCPFGYCPSTAACPNCRKTRKTEFSKPMHRANGCEKNHREFTEKLQNEKTLIEKGEALRTAAVGVENGMCKVWFTSKYEPRFAMLIPTPIYQKLGYGTVTLDDYEKEHGGTFQRTVA